MPWRHSCGGTLAEPSFEGRADVLAGNMGKCYEMLGYYRYYQKLIETPRKIRKAMLFQESQESTSKISKSHCQHVEPAHSLQLSAWKQRNSTSIQLLIYELPTHGALGHSVTLHFALHGSPISSPALGRPQCCPLVHWDFGSSGAACAVCARLWLPLKSPCLTCRG